MQAAQSLLNGATTQTTGIVDVGGMKNFTATFASTATTNNPTGTINLQAKANDSSAWIDLYSVSFRGVSGVMYQFNGPWNSIRSILNPTPTGVINPVLAGSYDVVIRYSN